MTATRYALFATPLGTCAIAWGERGVVRTFLPEPSAEAVRARLLRRVPDGKEAEPADDVRAVIAAITRLLAGEPVDLTWVRLDDETVPEFHRHVYASARAIPPGGTSTYGGIARALGDVGLARQVGEALGRNPFPIVVPCHRVLAAGGRTGGFSARGGTETKMQLLRIEGAVLL